jgi:septum formation protein
MIVLASTSASRRAMLTAAGVAHEALPAHVDEEAVKAGMAGVAPRDLADALAEMKALKISQRIPGTLVLGGDSVVAVENGTLLDKPASRDEAEAHLRMLSGKRHDLYSAAVIAENGRAVWRHVDRARLWVRPLSNAFIAEYLDAEWPAIAGCVGCYRVEGPGVQLFSRIEGSHYTILGMPLLNIIDYLRARGVLTS